MPSHPDRVRRNYHQPKLPLEPAGEARCDICDSGECAHVIGERGHAFAAAGVTANVIEGDPYETLDNGGDHNFWGV